ncbi:tripartite-type tricarboxylate transporter receptor subunit TctC [Humitalea rosea]|uniref:Tripartite-type tricarboxylate transporter receptor subunit TctC n=1 Tax=Humitalea rosea TaxID=990373 RepID=A0A2W7JA54_9PROT|nr:tripartite tricarboxylate transporter substrate binding protein [Humitalea rosea]PZW48322.1 tripartite-type tricarboxylate transporter receptor subunit TctC [Humitalea rosea]
MTMSRRQALAGLSLAALPLATLPRSAQAAGYPDRTIRVVVPFAPGGNADLVARILCQRMGERLGQTMVVDNRAGAGGSVGAEVVARAAPDGYTLLIGSNGPLTVNVLLQANLAYDPLTAFRPIGIANRATHVLVVGPARPPLTQPQTMAEFLARAKADPGGMGVGTPGAGSAAHLTLELFNVAAGIQTNHIPYRSGGALVPDLIAGNVPAAMVELSSVLSLHRDGKAKILAVAANTRASQLPDVPTFAEAGVPNFLAASYVGLLAPAGIPADVEARLASAFAAALTDDLLKTRVDESGGVVVTGPDTTPDGFATFLREELGRARRAAELAGLKPE